MRGRSINIAYEWVLEDIPNEEGCDVFILIVGKGKHDSYEWKVI